MEPFSHSTSCRHSALVKPPRWKSEGVELDPEGKVRADGVAHRGDGFEQEARAILQRATPAVGAAVGERAEELGDEIAMRGMQRDAGEAGGADLARGVGELADGVADLGLGHGARPGEGESRAADDIDLDIRRGERLGVDGAVDLAAGVAELGPELRAARRSGRGESFQRGHAALVVGDDVQRPFEVETVDLDIAGEKKSRAGRRPAPIEGFEAGGGMVVGIGQALAHRRLGDPVGQGRAVGQVERLGQERWHRRFPLWVRPRPRPCAVLEKGRKHQETD
ncbi:MAG: hypothetical protein WDM86_04275 [Rhizomicrobium sp.]